MNLTAKNIMTVPEGIHRYQRGLYLRVTSRSRAWLIKYSLNGKRREFGLGAAKGQSISAVLQKATEAFALIAKGIDPVEARREGRAQKMEAAPTMGEEEELAVTVGRMFDEAYEHVLKMRRFTSDVTTGSWYKTAKDTAQALGRDRPANSVTVDDIERILTPIWTTQLIKARRTKERLEAFFAYGMAKGYVTSNPAQWKGVLDQRLPSLSLVRRDVPEVHHQAVDPEELARVAKKLWLLDTPHALCALFGILTVGRRTEYRAAQWSEIDLKAETFSVPYDRRKDKKPEPFVVPLSRQAIKVLNRLALLGTEGPVFKGINSDMVSGASLLQCIKRCTDKPITLHGCRSTFSDWCATNEKNFLVSEKCLMHTVGNAVFRAYQRDTQLNQRKKLLQEWADFLLPEL